MIEKIAQYAKFFAALLGAFITTFAGLLPPEVSPWAQAVSAFLTAVAVILVPNALTEKQKEEDVPEYVAENGIGRHIA
jgi:uncharacterized membrane protein